MSSSLYLNVLHALAEEKCRHTDKRRHQCVDILLSSYSISSKSLNDRHVLGKKASSGQRLCLSPIRGCTSHLPMCISIGGNGNPLKSRDILPDHTIVLTDRSAGQRDL